MDLMLGYISAGALSLEYIFFRPLQFQGGIFVSNQ